MLWVMSRPWGPRAGANVRFGSKADSHIANWDVRKCQERTLRNSFCLSVYDRSPFAKASTSAAAIEPSTSSFGLKIVTFRPIARPNGSRSEGSLLAPAMKTNWHAVIHSRHDRVVKHISIEVNPEPDDLHFGQAFDGAGSCVACAPFATSAKSTTLIAVSSIR